MNPVLRLGLKENRTAFVPGEEIAGAVNWEMDSAPEAAEVRLCWFTRGKGTEDAGVVDTCVLDQPQAGDTRTFSFRAPEAPYSFSGKLISVIWAVELVLKPGNHFERVEIVIAPEGREVTLPGVEQSSTPALR